VLPLHLQSTSWGRAGHPDLFFAVSAAAWGVAYEYAQGSAIDKQFKLDNVQHWRNSMSSTNTSTSTFMQYSNQSMGYRRLPPRCLPHPHIRARWRIYQPLTLTRISFRSLASSLHSGKGSQPPSNMNNNNSLPRRPPSNLKRTYFSSASALIPLTGQSAVMSGVP
jgi:hypothetical protein